MPPPLSVGDLLASEICYDVIFKWELEMEASTEYFEIPKYVQNDRYCDLAAFFKFDFQISKKQSNQQV